MANGTYGNIKPADIEQNDVEIFYHYRPSRSTDDPDFPAFKKLDAKYLIKSQYAEEGNNNSYIELPGMYNLLLPMDVFGKKGIYTIYIKPIEIKTKIVDVSTLAAYPDIRGIVLHTDDNVIRNEGGALTGYRVEYLNNGVRTGEYRLITSSYSCLPVTQTLDNASQKGVRYILTDDASSELVFCTLTPSVSMSFNSDSVPNIGAVEQEIYLINTKFNPVMLEIEMVEHDDDTISTMLEGKQLRNLEKGLITTFDDEDGIYHQATYGNIANAEKQINHDFKFPKDGNIDFTEADKLNDIETVVDN